MGQAKIRSAEIAELKARGPRPRPQKPSQRHVTAFGAYYHDNLLDGVGIYLSDSFEPSPGWTNLTFHTLAQLVREEVASTTDANRAERIELAWTNLRENITSYNQQVFGSPGRRLDVPVMETELTDSLIETFIYTITNIWYLEQMGEIVNDDYNGMVIYAR